MRLTTLVVVLMAVTLLGAACVPVTLTPPAAPAAAQAATVPPAATQPAQAATATVPPVATQPAAATQPATATAQPAAAATMPAQGAATSPLAGSSWTAVTLNGQPVLAGTDVTLSLGTDGQATGSDGCNSYNTSYTADASAITFKQPIAGTMMACPDQIMNQANAYIKALGAAATYKAVGTGLAFADASGKVLVTFTTQSSELAGTAWQVISYNNGKQAVVSVAAGTAMTASFSQDGKLSGNAGCNDYAATYTTSGGNQISIGTIAATQKMCGQAGVMEQEQAYLAALQTAATYKIDGKKLELRTADGALAASFTAQPIATGLAGTSWEAMGYNNGKQAVVSVMPGTTITANFGQDGKVTGSSGCNDYSASYQIAGSNITIGQPASTRKMCGTPPGVMDQEQAYLAALTTAATWAINGGKLELRTADGALAADFNKASTTGLAGTAWDALGYNNSKQAVVSVMAGTTITANFGEAGNLSGNAGCNDYNATYQTSDNKIAIGAVASTRKTCPEAGVMEQEQAYLAALSTAATYSISGGKLELRTADGALAADYTKAQP